MKKLGFALAICLGLAMTVNASENDPKPVVKNYAEVFGQIEYPVSSREQGIEGTVLVKISVDEKGKLQKYEFMQSPCEAIKKVVENALPNLEFEPATVDGKAVASKVIIPIEFRLSVN